MLTKDNAVEIKPHGILNIGVPELITKQLKIKENSSGRRKITISTNWLNLYNFEPNSPVIEKSLGENKGIVVERVNDLLSVTKVKKVYQRTYTRRKNNPLESQLEVSSQKLINQSFPSDCRRVHITFQHGFVTIIPLLTSKDRAIINAQKASDKLSTFVAFSSGVDCFSLSKLGYSVIAAVEHRPAEARDKLDLTETGALNLLSNCTEVKALFNEDIYSIDVYKVAKYFRDNPFMFLCASPSCNDFSSLKNKNQVNKDIRNLSSNMDMTLDVLNLMEILCPPIALIENVSGWAKSPVYELLSLRLRRRGYKEHLLASADARDYGGLTSRKRAYAVYTVLDAPFEFESKTPRRDTPIWELITPHLARCRDVSHCRSIQEGARIGRLRVISKSSCHSPTPVKAQQKQTKDSVVIEHEGSYYWPTEDLLKLLLGIDQAFDLNSCSQSIGSEIIGQSIDAPLHESVLRSVKRHIEHYFN